MKKILSKQCRYMTYDPDQDQSARFGWPKYCDEHQPTEQEQDTWARISIAVTAVVTAIVWIAYIIL